MSSEVVTFVKKISQSSAHIEGIWTIIVLTNLYAAPDGSTPADALAKLIVQKSFCSNAKSVREYGNCHVRGRSSYSLIYEINVISSLIQLC